MIREHVKLQTNSVKLIGTLFFHLYMMSAQHCVISSAKSIIASKQCCIGEHLTNPNETFVINRFIISVFVIDDYRKVCHKQSDPLIRLTTESINITCIGVNETLQCNHENSNKKSFNYDVMNISFNSLTKCKIQIQIESQSNTTIQYIESKQEVEKECCVCPIYKNTFAIISNSYCSVNMSVHSKNLNISHPFIDKNVSNANESALQIELSPNLKLFQINPLPYEVKENDSLKPYPLFDIRFSDEDITALQKFQWKASIALIYNDVYPGQLLGTTNIMIHNLSIDKVIFNNLIITKWGYDYMLKVMLKSIPDYYSIEKTIGPFNVWSMDEIQFNRITSYYSDSRPITIILGLNNNYEIDITKSVNLMKMDLYLINYFGRIYPKLKWKNFFTKIVSNQLITNALISGSIENIFVAKSKLLYVINSTFNFDNQSFTIDDIAIDFDSNLLKSPLEQPEYQQQSKVPDNESNSLPIAWIAAIVINAILVLLFILFVIYCYCRSKKRRQRILNPDRDSVFSNKQSIQGITSNENLNKKKSANEPMTEKLPKNQQIFNIESEHKRLTENALEGESPTNMASGGMSLKSPANKVRTVNRFSSGARGSVHSINASNGNQYNPAESPSATMFSNQLKDSVPNQPKYTSKDEEEIENGNAENEYRTMDSLAEVDESNKVFQEDNFSDKSRGVNANSDNKEHKFDSIKQNELPYDLNSDNLTESQIQQVISSSYKPSISTTSDIITRIKSSRGNTPNRVSSAKKSQKSISPPHSSQSTAVQTSPNTSWLNIPGAVDGDDYYDETKYTLKGDTERKYFIYIIKDVNPYTKKECVGRITLPSRQRITLEQLRYYLLQSSDETLRNAAKKKFRFLSESYRLVAQNESFTPVDEVYPTQGIFIKFNASDSVPFAYKRRTKEKASEKTDAYNESIYGTNKKLQESIYGSKKKQNKDTTYGSLRSNEKTRFGYERTPKKREDLSFDKTPRKRDNFGFDRTPRKRDRLDTMTTPQPSIASPMVSPRTKMRLCQKMQIQSQIEKGLLEERPEFMILSLDSICDNIGCTNKPLLRCLICARVNYCSPACKKEHWMEHRFKCKKPPWKL